jgi:uncharacterized membrane protein YkoI
MKRRTMVSWVSFLGTVVVLGGVIVGVILIRPSSGEAVTAAPAGVMPSGQATKVAQKTEQLHVSHAKVAQNEDETALPPPPPAGPPVSPEQAIGVVQQSGLTSSQVSSIDLTVDASGRQVYEVRTGDTTGAAILVDATTGEIIPHGVAKP